MSGMSEYSYKKKGSVVATSAGAQNHYQMELIVGESSGASSTDVHCNNHCQNFPNDIRFTKEDGSTKHDYWIDVSSLEGTTPNRKVTVLIEVASIPASGSVNFYMYYGKAGDSGESNGNNTFPLFDDFDYSDPDYVQEDVDTYDYANYPGSAVEMPNGEIWMFYSQGDSTYHNWNGDFKVKYKVSADKGETWGASQLFYDTPNRLDHVGMTFREGNTVYFFWSTWTSSSNYANDLWMRKTTDSGVTWTDKVKIWGDNGVNEKFSQSGNIIKHGDVYLISIMYHYSSSPDEFRVYCIRSTDIEGTWTKGADVSIPETRGAMEPMIIELSTGDIYMDIRTKSGHRYKAVSSNDTTTWDTIAETAINSPESKSGILRLSNGHLMMVWNNASSTTQSPRYPLTIGISTDDFATFDLIKNIKNESGSNQLSNMGCPYELLNGTILFGYGHYYSATAHLHLDIARFKESDLDPISFEDNWETLSGSPIIEDSYLKLSSPNCRIKSLLAHGVGYSFESKVDIKSNETACIPLSFSNSTTSAPQDGDDCGVFRTYSETQKTLTKKDGNSEENDWTPQTGEYVYGIHRNAVSSVIFQRDGIVINTHTVQVPTSNGKIFFTVGHTNDEEWIDWTFVRKYVSPEPTWGTWSTEETTHEVALKKGLFYGKLGDTILETVRPENFRISTEINKIPSFEFEVANSEFNRTAIAANVTELFKIYWQHHGEDTHIFTGIINADSIEYVSRTSIRITGFSSYAKLGWPLYKHLLNEDAEPVNTVFDYHGSYSDYTAQANNDTANDVTASFGGVNDSFYVGEANPFWGLQIRYSTKGVGANAEIVTEYSKGGGTWGTLDLLDETNGFRNTACGTGATEYGYKKKGSVIATTAGAQTDYQMELIVGESSGASGANVHCNNHSQNFPNDIRFTKEDGATKHDYWIDMSSLEGTTPNRKVAVVIEVATIPASGAVDFYMYYGKAGDSGESNGKSTFPLFDDFGGVAGMPDYIADGSIRATVFTEENKILKYGTKTHIAYLKYDTAHKAYIKTYHHDTETWDSEVYIGTVYDAAGTPSIVVDNAGYLHILYDGHAGGIKHKKSINPNDATAWSAPILVSSADWATYSSVVCDSNNKLHLVYHETVTENIGCARYVRYEGGAWGNDVVLAGEDGYMTTYSSSIAIDANDVLHVGLFFFHVGESNGKKAGYAKSADGGLTWKKSDNTSYTLPISFASLEAIETGDNMRSSNIAADAGNHPMLVVLRRHNSPMDMKFWRFNGTSWVGTVISVSGKNIGQYPAVEVYNGVIYIFAPVYDSGQSFGHPSGEIYMFYSDDNGATFSQKQISTTDPNNPNLAPTVEKPNGNNTLPQMRLLWMNGNSHPTKIYFAKINTSYNAELYHFGAGGNLDDMWTVHEATAGAITVHDSTLKINEYQNKYAHIQQNYIVTNFIIQGRIKASALSGTTWAPKLFAVWDKNAAATDSAEVTNIGASYNNFWSAYIVADAHTVIHLGSAPFSTDWFWYRLIADEDNISASKSSDGKAWETYSIARPAALAGATELIGFGKGHARYSVGEEYNNSYTPAGDLALSQIDIVFIRKFITPEPTWGNWEAEETLGSTTQSAYDVIIAHPPSDWARNNVNGASKFWLRWRVVNGAYTTSPKLDRIHTVNVDVYRVFYYETSAREILLDVLEDTEYTMDTTDVCPENQINLLAEYESPLRIIAAIPAALTWTDVDDSKKSYQWWIDEAKNVHIKNKRGTTYQDDITGDLTIFNNLVDYFNISNRLIGMGKRDGLSQMRSIVENKASQTIHELRELAVSKNDIGKYTTLKESIEKDMTFSKAPMQRIKGSVTTEFWGQRGYEVGDTITLHQGEWVVEEDEFQIVKADIGPLMTTLNLGISREHLEGLKSNLQRAIDINNVQMHGSTTIFNAGPETSNYERKLNGDVYSAKLKLDLPTDTKKVYKMLASWTIGPYRASVNETSGVVPAHSHGGFGGIGGAIAADATGEDGGFTPAVETTAHEHKVETTVQIQGTGEWIGVHRDPVEYPTQNQVVGTKHKHPFSGDTKVENGDGVAVWGVAETTFEYCEACAATIVTDLSSAGAAPEGHWHAFEDNLETDEVEPTMTVTLVRRGLITSLQPYAFSKVSDAEDPAHLHAGVIELDHAHTTDEILGHTDHVITEEEEADISTSYGIHEEPPGTVLELVVDGEVIGEYSGDQTEVRIDGYLPTTATTIELRPIVSELDKKGSASIWTNGILFVEPKKF